MRRALVFTLTALALLAGPATASKPDKGETYRGVVTTGAGTMYEVDWPIRFEVSKDGKSVGPFLTPLAKDDGTPRDPDCAEGPIGNPDRKTVRLGRGGSVEAKLPLRISDQDPNGDFGYVRITGKFEKDGRRFNGTFETHTPSKYCNGSWSFSVTD